MLLHRSFVHEFMVALGSHRLLVALGGSFYVLGIRIIEHVSHLKRYQISGDISNQRKTTDVNMLDRLHLGMDLDTSERAELHVLTLPVRSGKVNDDRS